ncbi:prepilin-type N-terminal cleavage/methylation domain-containing protein [Coxiella-like endosymbiont]|uniref:prepilin-type N-terminal cleavage/methylation domain-containing protein n=1 Tax=Coxiella-like endosymbiont TaxID=1592897 RepID=UPI00272C7EBD|nr:prepilin-type N-terminal cleavage/methylation domain-containing protein [Coxiella-like endosymbiont]
MIEEGHPYHYLNPGKHGDIHIFTYASNNEPDGEGINVTMRNWNIITKNNKNQEGFTLFEVVVVMTIIAIITTIAFLSLHRFDRGRQVMLLPIN